MFAVPCNRKGVAASSCDPFFGFRSFEINVKNVDQQSYDVVGRSVCLTLLIIRRLLEKSTIILI